MKTKLITLIIFVFLLTSCSCTTRENTGRKENTGIQPRFKVGDVVYLKPDSIKAVIEEVNKCGCLGGCLFFGSNRNGPKFFKPSAQDLQDGINIARYHIISTKEYGFGQSLFFS